jgi:hypothetical protein
MQRSPAHRPAIPVLTRRRVVPRPPGVWMQNVDVSARRHTAGGANGFANLGKGGQARVFNGLSRLLPAIGDRQQRRQAMQRCSHVSFPTKRNDRRRPAACAAGRRS